MLACRITLLARLTRGRLVPFTRLTSRPCCESPTTAARSTGKVVLVSYLERNKKISIPEHKSEGDVEYLRREFLKSFYSEKNVKLHITFQHFDPEWEEYVDLDEDTVVPHKKKLKAIVTRPPVSYHLLSDRAPTTSGSVIVVDSEVTICMICPIKS